MSSPRSGCLTSNASPRAIAQGIDICSDSVLNDGQAAQEPGQLGIAGGAMSDTIRPSSRERVIEGTDLQRGAIGLVGATMQNITHIAPAIAALFFTQFVVSLAGITAPLAYLFGVIVVLMLGSTLVQLSKHMPSAGGDSTYQRRGPHPPGGFLSSRL